MSHNFNVFIDQVKSLSGLSPELESCLKEIAPIVIPHLKKVTDSFYVQLIMIPNTSKFLELHLNKLDQLKETHLNWMISLFTLDINAEFAKNMSKVGDIHVTIQLPIEFMAGSMCLINKELVNIIIEEFSHDQVLCARALQATGAVMGLTLMIMQKSYQLWD